ncbi:MAG TPA: hypothetical protein VFL91_06375 [Thermomicrobiales bacterium]|nr:hypothetical protein [Thermomicrobiales bacterium]
MGEEYRRRRRALERLRALRDFVEGRRRHPLAILHAPAPPADAEAEAAFQALLIDLLRECGWWVHHETDSRRTAGGYPDLVAVRPPRVVFAELKTARGRVREEQGWWADDLARCPGVEYHCWRPADWPAILATIAPPGQTMTLGRDAVLAVAPAPPDGVTPLRRRAR